MQHPTQTLLGPGVTMEMKGRASLLSNFWEETDTVLHHRLAFTEMALVESQMRAHAASLY